jgi:RNA polymerase sigma-70 factor, ECF subfamily
MSVSRIATPAKVNASDDIATIQRALSGDADALSALFAKGRTKLYNVAFSLLRNREDAEDAVQDALLSAYLNLQAFEGRARFSTWLTRIVLNSALMKRRRLRKHLQVSFRGNDAYDATALPEIVDTRPNPEEACALAETRGQLRCGLERLSPALRSAFYLTDVRQLSTSDAAKAAGIKISAIKSRAVRARGRLASLLDPNTLGPSRPQFFASSRESRKFDRMGSF